MRGTLAGCSLTQLLIGIIPADAGNTTQILDRADREGDHPRGCGEHWQDPLKSSAGRGSSPRMRGTQINNMFGADGIRIIPADAGNTYAGTPVEVAHEDHPRGCGEHPCYMYCVPGLKGSSPRMRGTHHLVIVDCMDDRIIPADAGNTIRYSIAIVPF